MRFTSVTEMNEFFARILREAEALRITGNTEGPARNQ
jgi:hypothetical protein